MELALSQVRKGQVMVSSSQKNIFLPKPQNVTMGVAYLPVIWYNKNKCTVMKESATEIDMALV